MTKKPNKLPNLEDSLSEITQLIDRMEHSEQTLEQSLDSFERGITLVRHCQKILDQAEQKVQILMQNNNQEELIPYDNNDQQQGPEIDEANND
ncbi:Exodeoxyribonuclease 7 small subunit [Aquicella siphonis]|uniref:Exodeoxyribonuclease 7 small subunit n=1 Tax=Aquicella siphonis TaxID=254247 RepID=A0A5E4PJI1_9COXI|nr:exodeoxyribonuclease VII small subunit [Aquicella siphonis]VVC76532.1 Exodeoxyribonuclease 7 small subunit [Aquicella siphonis]